MGWASAPDAPPWLRQLPSIETLRMVWVQQFWLDDGRVRLREPKRMAPSRLRVDSPYDGEARYSTKRGADWRGYKVHLTEVRDADAPHLITHDPRTGCTRGMRQRGEVPCQASRTRDDPNDTP
ncbi:hypothetical protein [Streptomyces sp. NPDC046197]|uniref:hypothetical protein n=1 Tax=Streptomyces sp. NPDC046197 TaxID=3154337 RepID=UPI0033F75EB1